MGFEHSLSHEEKLARLVGLGELDIEACVAAIRRLAIDLIDAPGYGILLDMRGTDYLGSPAELRQYAGMMNEIESLKGHRLAIVVKSMAQFGMGRMYTIYHEFQGGEAAVFRELEPAMAWLTGAGKA